MRIVADENAHAGVIATLRRAGHEVEAVAKREPSADVARMLSDGRLRGAIFITYDRDFGDLIFRRGLEPPLGVLYVRMPLRDSAAIAARLIDLLAGGHVRGRFLVIERERTRTRDINLPPGAQDA